jgi:hypothetical protein
MARLQYIVFTLIGLIGVLFVFLGVIASNSILSAILISVGTSVIATAIVSWVIRLSLGDPTDALVAGITATQGALEKIIIENVQIIHQSAQVGLISFWSARQDLQTDFWIDCFRSARIHIKLLAYAMAFLPDHPDFVDVLEDRLKAGCDIYLNVGDPQSTHVRSRAMESSPRVGFGCPRG